MTVATSCGQWPPTSPPSCGLLLPPCPKDQPGQMASLARTEWANPQRSRCLPNAQRMCSPSLLEVLCVKCMICIPSNISYVMTWYAKDRCVDAYIKLAAMSLERRQLRWPSRPKIHVSFMQIINCMIQCIKSKLSIWSLGISGNLPHSATRQHLGLYMVMFNFQKIQWQKALSNFPCFHSLPWGQNGRFSHSFHTEDFVGKLTNALCTTQMNGMEEAGLVRWYTGSLGLVNAHEAKLYDKNTL
jgi:hypothetical protein